MQLLIKLINLCEHNKNGTTFFIIEIYQNNLQPKVVLYILPPLWVGAQQQ